MNEQQKEQNSVVDRLKKQAEKRIRNLQTTLEGKLRSLTLDQLADVTQMIGTEMNQAFLSIASIATELLRRIKTEGPFTAEARAGEVVKKETILPTMSKEEIEEVIEELKRFTDESDAPSNTIYLKFSKIEPSSSKETSGLKELKKELQGFEQELKRLKGK